MADGLASRRDAGFERGLAIAFGGSPLVPSQYCARASFHADSKSFGLAASRVGPDRGRACGAGQRRAIAIERVGIVCVHVARCCDRRRVSRVRTADDENPRYRIPRCRI